MSGLRRVQKDGLLNALGKLATTAKGLRSARVADTEGRHLLGRGQLVRRAVDELRGARDRGDAVLLPHYNTALSICRTLGAGRGAVDIIGMMRDTNTKPTQETYSFALHAIGSGPPGEKVDMEAARAIWRDIRANHTTPCEHCYASLMFVIARAAREAGTPVDETRRRLLQILQRMLQQGIPPDVRHYGKLLAHSKDTTSALELADFCMANAFGALPLEQYFASACKAGLCAPEEAVRVVVDWYARHDTQMDRQVVFNLFAILRAGGLHAEAATFWEERCVEGRDFGPTEVAHVLAWEAERVSGDGVSEEEKAAAAAECLAMMQAQRSRVGDFHVFTPAWVAAVKLLVAAGEPRQARDILHVFMASGGVWSSRVAEVADPLGVSGPGMKQSLVVDELSLQPHRNAHPWEDKIGL